MDIDRYSRRDVDVFFGGSLTESEIAKIWLETEGSPRLIEYLRVSPHAVKMLPDVVMQELILNPISERRLLFLTTIACAVTLPHRLVAELWPHPDREDLIRWALDTDMMNRSADLALVGQIPRAWRRGLLALGRSEFPREVESGIQAALAWLRRNSSHPREILEQALLADDSGVLPDLVERYGYTLMVDSPETMAEAMCVIPEIEFERRPKLAHYRFVMSTLFTEDGRVRVQPSAVRYSPAKHTGQLIASMIGARLCHKYSAALRIAEDIHDVDTGGLAIHLAITRILAGRLDLALTDLRRALAFSERDDEPLLRRDALGKRALVLAIRGEIEHAQSSLEEARRLPLARGAVGSMIESVELTTALLLAVESMDVETVRRLYRFGTHPLAAEEEFWPFRLIGLARASELLNTPTAGLETLSTFERRDGTQREWLHELIRAQMIRMLLSNGDQPGARKMTMRLSRQRNHVSTITRAYVAVYDGKFTEVLGMLEGLIGAPNLGPAQHAEIALLRASAFYELGCIDEARMASRDSESLAEVYGLRRTRSLLPSNLLERLRGGLGLVPVPALFPPSTTRPSLTPAMRTVLRYLHSDKTLEEIAETMHVSRNTVKSHVRRLYEQLGVHSRTDAVKTALRVGLL